MLVCLNQKLVCLRYDMTLLGLLLVVVLMLVLVHSGCCEGRFSRSITNDQFGVEIGEVEDFVITFNQTAGRMIFKIIYYSI